jgi:hypothetical protein
MTKLLIIAATLGFAASSAAACVFMRSAAVGTDDTKVASISADKQQNMSTPVSQPLPDVTPVIVEQEPATGAPAKAE